MKTYKVKKGWHFAWPFHIGFRWNPTAMTKVVNFDRSSLYTLTGENHMQINKLFGLSYGRHSNNSARFGWRVNPAHPGKIEILAYARVAGRVVGVGVWADTNITLGFIDVETDSRMTITKDDVNYNFSFLDQNDKLLGCLSIPHLGTVPKWSYDLNFFFGGTKPAPQDVAVTFK